ncbi:hypothetical protein B0H13DRAFT_1854915 [Mycena leptocephala]|nr:hypothetical protein B0H13DRAFT_1854915 [Mycena leptocephala]
MTRFPGHAQRDLQAGSKMVACSSHWSSRAIHFKRGSKMVACDTRWSARPEQFTASGVSKIVARSSGWPSRRLGRALLQAGMRDGRLHFPTPSRFFCPQMDPLSSSLRAAATLTRLWILSPRGLAFSGSLRAATPLSPLYVRLWEGSLYRCPRGDDLSGSLRATATTLIFAPSRADSLLQSPHRGRCLSPADSFVATGEAADYIVPARNHSIASSIRAAPALPPLQYIVGCSYIVGGSCLGSGEPAFRMPQHLAHPPFDSRTASSTPSFDAEFFFYSFG